MYVSHNLASGGKYRGVVIIGLGFKRLKVYQKKKDSKV